jgi:hypothetical protein
LRGGLIRSRVAVAAPFFDAGIARMEVFRVACGTTRSSIYATAAARTGQRTTFTFF